MGLVTELLIAERYGMLLDFQALGALLNKSPGTLENQWHQGKLPFKMHKNGGRLVAHYADVAAYIDSIRSRE